MADNILDQLKAFQESRDAARRTADEILRERDLLREVSRLAKSINIEFNETTRNIGNSATKLQIGEELQEKLKRSLQDRNAIERSLLNQLETRVKHESEISELSRIASLNSVDLNREYADRNALLMKELTLGTINNAQYAEQLNILNEMYVNTASQLNVRRELLNRTNSEINNTRVLLNSENKRLDRLETQNKLMEVGKGVLTDMGPLGDKIIGFRTITAGNLLVDILKKGYENFKAFDKASVDIRKNLGALPGQVNLIENNLKNVTIELMDVGATFDDVGKSINAITDEINGLVARDKDLLKTTTAIAKQFGISESTGAKFLKTLGGISGNSASSQRSMVGFAQKIAVAAGIPLGKLMEDVASASDDVRIYVGNSAVSLIKAAAAARMLGTDLNKAAATAEKLLQFESSIGSELKASALLGRNINFNYARQLAFNKDIIGANKEVLRIAKQVNFNQLNPIQQKAFADAAGKSVSELQDMFQQEKNIALVRNGTNKEAKKALEDYERMMKLKDEEAKNEGKLAEQDILKRANQERLIQLQNKFNQLMSELAKPVMQITEDLLDIAVIVLPFLVKGVQLVIKAFELLSGVYIAKTVLSIKNLLIPWKGITESFNVGLRLINTMGKGAGLLTKILGPFGKLLMPFSKLLGPVGIVISLVQGLVSLFGTFKSAFKDFGEGKILSGIIKIFTAFPKMLIDITLGTIYDIVQMILGWFGVDIPKGIWNGINSIGDMLFEGILSPFKSAWDWLKQTFMGESPSQLGLSIVGGIISVGNMLMENIKSPFFMAYNYVTNLFSGIGDSIIEGIKSVGTSIIDSVTSPFKSSYNWIMDNLGGKSPSEIGLSILNGMTSVNAKLTDSISNPFKSAFDSILGLAPTDLGLLIISGLQDNLISAIDPFKSSLNSVFEDFGKNLSSEIASSITSGLKSSESAIQNSVNTSLSNITLPTTEFNIGEVNEPTTKKIEATNSPIQQVIEVGNQQLIQKIDQLINLMSNGGIAVNLDGQLVSRTLASTAYKSGGFGQSTTRA